LLELTDDIDSYLEYFQELEPATRMLNHPGESLIFQSDFLYMVERVDICIDFLKSHVSLLRPCLRPMLSLICFKRHFKESEVYLLRYQQCMTRAMTLIKMNFVGSLRALSSDVLTRLSEKVHIQLNFNMLFVKLFPGRITNSSNASTLHSIQVRFEKSGSPPWGIGTACPCIPRRAIRTVIGVPQCLFLCSQATTRPPHIRRD
jgi:hypothetical protein